MLYNVLRVLCGCIIYDSRPGILVGLLITGWAAITGGATAIVGVPVLIGALGYKAAGIAASSYAAKLMTAFAVANGGGVAAGGLVAVLQSIAAGGMGAVLTVSVGVGGAVVGAVGAVYALI